MTEVVTTAIHASALIAANETLCETDAKNAKRRSILGALIPDCNPYRPRWEEFDNMTPTQQANRTENHIRKLTYQWYQCAKKSRNEDIQAYYTEKVRRIKTQDVDKWKGLVQDIVVDDSMDTAPKVYNAAQEAQRAAAQKRKARGQDGPVGRTPNSDERKPKERRQKIPDEDTEEDKIQNTEEQDKSESIEAVMECTTEEGEPEAFDTLDETIASEKVQGEEGKGQDNECDTGKYGTCGKTNNRKPFQRVYEQNNIPQGEPIAMDPRENTIVKSNNEKHEHQSREASRNANGNKENKVNL